MQSSDRFIVALQNKAKKKIHLYTENTATFDPNSPQTGSENQIGSCGLTKLWRRPGQMAFPVIACHHFSMPLSELFS